MQIALHIKQASLPAIARTVPEMGHSSDVVGADFGVMAEIPFAQKPKNVHWLYSGLIESI